MIAEVVMANDDGATSSVQMVALAVAGGAALGFAPARRRANLVRAVGLGLLGGAAWTALGKQLLPIGAARRAVRLKTSITIRRPITEIFSFFKDFEHFPMLVTGVSAVEDFGDGRSHWR